MVKQTMYIRMVKCRERIKEDQEAPVRERKALRGLLGSGARGRTPA